MHYRKETLDEFLCLDGLGDANDLDLCIRCGIAIGDIKCNDCTLGGLQCFQCTLEAHECLPFHSLEVILPLLIRFTFN